MRLTNDPTMQHSIPDINDRGEIVFGKFISGTDVWNIHVFSNGVFHQLTPDDAIRLNPAINNASEMAWYGRDDLDDKFDLYASFSEIPIRTDSLLIGSPAMNDAGDIVWAERITPGVSEFDVYLYTREKNSVHRITNGGNNQAVRLNNNGQIVWRQRDDSVNPWMSRVMLYTDGEITSIAPGDCQCSGTDINDPAHVVWSDEVGLSFWNGDNVRFIAPLAATAHVNNRDEIGFAIWDLELNRAIHAVFKDGFVYTLPDFGMTSARSAINDRGEMVMRYFDDRTGHIELFLLRRIAPKGDNNHDCRIDLADFGKMQVCAQAVPGPEGTLLADCIRFDFDDDGDVDITDFSCFFEQSTGPDGSVDQCTP